MNQFFILFRIKTLYFWLVLDNPAENAEALELYEKTERIRKFLYNAFVKITLPGVLMPALFSTIVNYFISDLGDESYLLASPISWAIGYFFFWKYFILILSFCRTPFNWRSPIGYTIAFLIETIATSLTCLVSAPYHYLITGSCYGLAYLVKNITNEVHELKMDDISLNDNRKKFKVTFCRIVERISAVKQLSEFTLYVA